MALLPELDTRSVLNVVEENFQKVGLKTYGFRMMYTGEHTLTKELVMYHINKSVRDVNASYCEVPVTGLLLVYDSYFVHIIEGSEDTVHRQIRFLLAREQEYVASLMKEEAETEGLAALEEDTKKPETKMFRRLKVLMVYHSVKTMMFEGWRSVCARPATLVTKPDPYAPAAQHMEQLRICLDKLFKLCAIAQAEDELTFEGLSAVDPKIEALPEVVLLDFLLSSPHVIDVRKLAHMHRRVDDYIFYFEETWPLPTHFTPRLLYKLKVDDTFVDPLPIMPWEMVKKETEDEENVERESNSDSSD